MINITYVSNLCSIKKIKYLLDNSKIKPLQSIQRYHRLLCEGLIFNDAKINTITAIPVTPKAMKRKFWLEKDEEENDIKYRYMPFINIIVIRQLFLFIMTFIYVIKDSIKDKERVFICDALTISISVATLLATRIMKRKCVLILTDFPDSYFKKSFLKKIWQFELEKYDYYIFLTEHMNKIINTNNKPYIIIEGVCEDTNISNYKKYDNFVFMYAGGLYKKYGLKNFIDAFLKLKYEDVQLHIYGSGELEDYLKQINDNRIKYYGVVQNTKILEEEYKVTVLVNPRFSNEEYTKYSFPSKNMEYMSSGTPVLTTKLCGIPEEYFDYCYTFSSEDVNGMYDELNKLYKTDRSILQEKGKSAKQFVINNKNKIIQAKNIIEMLRK